MLPGDSPILSKGLHQNARLSFQIPTRSTTMVPRKTSLFAFGDHGDNFDQTRMRSSLTSNLVSLAFRHWGSFISVCQQAVNVTISTFSTAHLGHARLQGRQPEMPGPWSRTLQLSCLFSLPGSVCDQLRCTVSSLTTGTNRRTEKWLPGSSRYCASSACLIHTLLIYLCVSTGPACTLRHRRRAASPVVVCDFEL
ncbi:hypothetical protein LIA77_04315 [Sarocladium implicatum]|nr:hypothetical protein LIA77_04315 [Sarocladium implicatum]